MRLLSAIAAAGMMLGCGSLTGQDDLGPDAGGHDETESDASVHEPVAIDITRAVGFVPTLGGADYEVDVSARASRYSFCEITIACDGVPLRPADDMILPTAGTTVYFMFYAGVPECSERTLEIVCPGGSASSIWSAQ